MSKSEVYYFSGTGNSLAVARYLAEKTNGMLIPVSTVIEKSCIESDADVIGIVFPVYNHGIPLIIRRFAEKIEDPGSKYIFGICTYGGNPCIALEYLDNILKLKKGRLAAGFAIKMPYNYISPTLTIKDFFGSFTLREVPLEDQQKMFIECNKKLEFISGYINARKEGVLETKLKAVENLIDYLNLRDTMQKAAWLKVAGFGGSTELTFQESIQLMDHGFYCDNKCKHCSTCAKVCPVNNIRMDNGRPIWNHHCEQCFACLQWCPEEAIQYGKKTTGRKRYHHPDVKLQDMFL
ncbi:MAG: EFR1 family ferrodoxin [Bacillota bacterium]